MNANGTVGAEDETDEEYATAFWAKYGRAPLVARGRVLRRVVSVRIVNIVVTAALKAPLNLAAVKAVLAHCGAEYTTIKKFPSLGLHMVCDASGARAAMSVFATGRIVCHGCQTESGSIAALFRVADMLEVRFPGIGPPRLTVRNIVSCMRMDVAIDLKVLHRHIAATVTHDRMYHPPVYDAVDFPGLQWKSGNGLQYLVFGSGAVVITNGHDRDHVRRGVIEVHDIVYSCARAHPGSVQRANGPIDEDDGVWRRAATFSVEDYVD